MAARNTLLALLAEGPAHGYLLGKRLRAKLGPAWEINSGNVSTALKKLEKQGLVRVVDGEAGQDDRKLVVELTEAGAVELDRWFGGETDGVRVASPEFLAKVSLGGQERCEESLEHITAYEADCVKVLEQLQAHRDSVPIWPVATAERLLKRCATVCEMMQVEAQLQGAMLVRETIAELKDNDALWGSASAQSDADKARKREQAREEVFRRMAKRHLDVVPGDDGAAHG
jgi:DNA-binding PadR family transcriptional regulator